MGAAAQTHLGGNSSPPMISGQGSSNKALEKIVRSCSRDAYRKFGFRKFGYCDAGIEGGEVRIGVEPAYFGEDLKLLCINVDKDYSRFITGHAFGYWGSGVRSQIREYGDYKRKSKFTQFVDKWHPLLFPEGLFKKP